MQGRCIVKAPMGIKQIAARLKLSTSQRGFTLVELLIVIAIIAVLSGIIMSALSSAQKGSRDARRRSDLKQYQTSLMAHKIVNFDVFPNYTSCATAPCAVTTTTSIPASTLVSNQSMSKALLDPTNNSTYRYMYRTSTTGDNFGMCAQLERNTAKMFVVGPTYTGEQATGTCAVAG